VKGGRGADQHRTIPGQRSSASAPAFRDRVAEHRADRVSGLATLTAGQSVELGLLRDRPLIADRQAARISAARGSVPWQTTGEEARPGRRLWATSCALAGARVERPRHDDRGARARRGVTSQRQGCPRSCTFAMCEGEASSRRRGGPGSAEAARGGPSGHRGDERTGVAAHMKALAYVKLRKLML